MYALVFVAIGYYIVNVYPTKRDCELRAEEIYTGEDYLAVKDSFETEPHFYCIPENQWHAEEGVIEANKVK